MKELQSAQKQISDLRSEVAQAQLPLLTGKAETLASGAQMLAVQVDGMDAKSLQVSVLSGHQLMQWHHKASISLITALTLTACKALQVLRTAAVIALANTAINQPSTTNVTCSA